MNKPFRVLIYEKPVIVKKKLSAKTVGLPLPYKPQLPTNKLIDTEVELSKSDLTNHDDQYFNKVSEVFKSLLNYKDLPPCDYEIFIFNENEDLYLRYRILVSSNYSFVHVIEWDHNQNPYEIGLL
jgi:hypothetical protein